MPAAIYWCRTGCSSAAETAFQPFGDPSLLACSRVTSFCPRHCNRSQNSDTYFMSAGRNTQAPFPPSPITTLPPSPPPPPSRIVLRTPNPLKTRLLRPGLADTTAEKRGERKGGGGKRERQITSPTISTLRRRSSFPQLSISSVTRESFRDSLLKSCSSFPAHFQSRAGWRRRELRTLTLNTENINITFPDEQRKGRKE